MWGVFLLSTSSPSAEPSFSEQYERGYNTFNPASRYAPDNPLNPAQAFALDTLFNGDYRDVANNLCDPGH
ncbi:MAG: hypothetical protein OEV27_04390 [Nitrospira sp.]|jgi:hypothetical protein|nr:hypothetical protein [Nitrospira sp.]MDH4250408.1 hypothetical protein [Nitrospira sp.]MDH4342573.1 hypothetical protein [Nitrospira sp.]MDH5335776.1 hypothetical protein [Nitrospira sp.]